MMVARALRPRAPATIGAHERAETQVGGAALSDGFRFTPGLGSWIRMARGGASGVGARAVWSGTEMLEWAPNNGLLRYDPRADQWTTAALGCALRPAPSLVWTGTELILWRIVQGVGAAKRYDAVATT